MTDLVVIPTAALVTVAGGAAGPNKDSSTTVLGGAGYEKDYKSRTDQSYRLDAVKEACTQKNTDWFWGTDQQKVGQCVLDNMNPKQ